MRRLNTFSKQFFILLLLSSCNLPEHYWSPAPECQNREERFNDESSISAENQTLLREKIRNQQPKNYRYFFETFIEEGEHTYMITNFRNEVDCFDIKLLVTKWDKLAGMHRVNGKAYPKELYDLQWTVKTVNSREEVVYIDMHRIID